jgi:serine/threonine protein kinase
MGILYIYDVDGSATEEPTDAAYDIFRKVLNKSDVAAMTEFEIAKRLFKKPQKNVVQIYDVVEKDDICWIDMECLDDGYKPLSAYMINLKCALEQLHTLGVVYIDIKSDNIGYSTKDGVFKLFDFDCSGIVYLDLPTQWEREPLHISAKYQQLKFEEDKVASLYELDNIAFELEYKKRLV